MRLHTPVNSWGPQGPARGWPPRHRGRPRWRGHTLHLPQTWERRPCSATCSPGARRETLPYTSAEAGSLPKRRMRPRPAREPERRPGLARSPRASEAGARGLPRGGRGGGRGVWGSGGGGRGERACCPAGRRSPLRRPSLPRRGSRALRSALAFPAECHHYHSKGKGPAEGVAGGPTAPQDGRARGQGQRAGREPRHRQPPGTAAGTATPETPPGWTAGGDGGEGPLGEAGQDDPVPQFLPPRREPRGERRLPRAAD